METLHPGFGVVLTLLSPHCVMTGHPHELIWAPAAAGMQQSEEGDGVQLSGVSRPLPPLDTPLLGEDVASLAMDVIH